MRGSSLLRIAIASAFATCLFASSASVAARAAGAACQTPAGWKEVAARRTRYVVLGEIHGTRESPAFLGSLACALASRGERVLVGVEKEAIANAALQQAWKLPERQFAARLRTIGWAGRSDGVGSQAMFDLLVALHRLKGQGLKIDLVAFNGFRDEQQGKRFGNLPGQGPHEAAQAENIRLAAEAGRYDHVLVLVGNLHARKTPVGEGPTRFEPMVMRLAPPSAVTSLNMRSSGGTMWNCLRKPGFPQTFGKDIPPEAMDCGNHPTGRQGQADLGSSPFLRLGAFPGEPVDPSYDGFYWLGTVNGSPPAVPDP